MDLSERPDTSSFFIEDVDKFMEGQTDVQRVLETLNEEYKKMKYLEAQVSEQKEQMKIKVPEIQKTLQILQHLQSKAGEESTTNYELTNNIWAEATLEKDDVCYLWLGANVMVEYTYPEAIAVLETNLEQGKKMLEKYTSDLNYLKEQVTVAEVNVARVYNYGIKQKKTLAAK